MTTAKGYFDRIVLLCCGCSDLSDERLDLLHLRPLLKLHRHHTLTGGGIFAWPSVVYMVESRTDLQDRLLDIMKPRLRALSNTVVVLLGA